MQAGPAGSATLQRAAVTEGEAKEHSACLAEGAAPSVPEGCDGEAMESMPPPEGVEMEEIEAAAEQGSEEGVMEDHLHELESLKWTVCRLNSGEVIEGKWGGAHRRYERKGLQVSK